MALLWHAVGRSNLGAALYSKAFTMLFRYPALVTGTPRGFRKPRLCVVVRETDIPIKSVTGNDAPVAAILRSKQHVLGQLTLVELPVRHIDGRFYIPAAVDTPALPGMLADPFFQCPIRSPLLNLLTRRFPVHEMERERVWPQGVGLFLSLGAEFPGLHDLKDTSRSVVLTDEGLADAAFADRMAENMHTHYLLVDGVPWRQVPEPAFVAHLANGKLHLVMDEMRGVVPGKAGDCVAFPVTAHDAAVDAMHLFGYAASTAGDAVVITPEVFSENFHDVNYARFARHLAANQPPGPTGSELARVLTEIDNMTSTRVDMIDFELLDDAVSQALAESQRLEAAEGRPALAGIDRRIMDFQVDLWEGRAIEIAGVVPSARFTP